MLHMHSYHTRENHGKMTRLFDWMTVENPLINRYPEITCGWMPDKDGNSGGDTWEWKTVRLVRKPVRVGLGPWAKRSNHLREQVMGDVERT